MYTLHFQDSQVARVTLKRSDLHIVLSSAAVAVTDVGAAADGGYLSPVVMVLGQATCDGDLTQALGRLREGELRARGGDAATPCRALSLPQTRDGHLQLLLEFANGAMLKVTATSLHIALRGDERFTESYAC